VKGFSLVEVLVAMALLATTALGLAELFALSDRVTLASRVDTVATMAAQSKMAQLRALTWRFDAAGGPVSDAGLAISPASSLTTSTDGYVDYVDAGGASVGAGAEVPPEAVYLRRWQIQPLPSDPGHTLVLQVVAARVTQPAARDAHLIAILARTSR
jgi:prepilin-type N-terminal cleavage/methylation domain-containing protein